MTGRKQDAGTCTHRLTKNAGVLLQGADTLLGPNRVLTVSMRTVRVQTRAANHYLKHGVVIPIAGPLHAKLKVLVAIEETLNVVQIVFARGRHLTGDTRGIEVGGEFIAAHGERH